MAVTVASQDIYIYIYIFLFKIPLSDISVFHMVFFIIKLVRTEEWIDRSSTDQHKATSIWRYVFHCIMWLLLKVSN